MTTDYRTPRFRLTSDERGRLEGRFDEIKARLMSGALSLPVVMGGLQDIIEGTGGIRGFKVFQTIRPQGLSGKDYYVKMAEAQCAVSLRVHNLVDAIKAGQPDQELICFAIVEGSRITPLCNRTNGEVLLRNVEEAAPRLGLLPCELSDGPEIQLARTAKHAGSNDPIMVLRDGTIWAASTAANAQAMTYRLGAREGFSHMLGGRDVTEPVRASESFIFRIPPEWIKAYMS